MYLSKYLTDVTLAIQDTDEDDEDDDENNDGNDYHDSYHVMKVIMWRKLSSEEIYQVKKVIKW